MLKIGSVIDGKYKILNKIGQGGMSVVYLAMNERANKQWAIKEIRKDGVMDYEVVRQNLIAETDIMKKLSHAHLPSIIDVIDYEDTFIIVMDYIEGITLNDVLEREGVQPQEQVIEWAKQICDVLGYLHSRKPPIIYRDMKPSNVMLKPDGNIMIIDFGTAREYKYADVEDTACLGTRGYAAPEQYGGHGQTDARTDIYCLGATIYHLVTGHNPSQPPYEMKPIREWNHNLSSGLEQIIHKCTAADPDARYQTCAELMYALEHYSDLDLINIRRRERKWKTFLTTAIMAIVFLVSSIGFKVAESSATKNSYDKLMDSAMTATTESEKIEKYQAAIDVDPRREEAYISMLNTLLDDDNFSQEDTVKIKQSLGYTGKRNRENRSYLEGNKKGYEEFAYQMGLAYYYYYEEDGNKSMSQPWFAIAAQADTLDNNKIARAERLGRIAKYYASLDSRDKAGDSSTTYKDYWKDLTDLVSGNLVEMDNNKTAIVMYNEMVSQIGTNCNKFKAAGVEKDQLLNELERIETRMETDIIPLSESERGEINTMKASLQESIEWARRQVEIVYSGKATVPANQQEGGQSDAG